MNCNILGVISILLIISIVVLVFYRNMNDLNTMNTMNNMNDINTNNIEPFFDPIDDRIISNNIIINNLLKRLTSIKPTIDITSNKNSVNYDFETNIATNISSNVSTIVTNYSTNSDINSRNITDLENKLIDLENLINNKKIEKLNNTKYSTIKSLNNGMEMNLFSTPNTLFQDITTGKVTDSYLVGVNNGCLSVGANNYDVYKCDDKNPKQMFKMQHIINETDYANNIDKAIPFDNVNKSTISYPFAMIKSVNNDNCLTNNHGTLTVQPCYSFIAQRWFPM